MAFNSIDTKKTFVQFPRKDYQILGISSISVADFADKILRIMRNNILTDCSAHDADALIAMFCQQQVSPSQILCFPPSGFLYVNEIKRLDEFSAEEQRKYVRQISQNLNYIANAAKKILSQSNNQDLITIASFLYDHKCTRVGCLGTALRFPSRENIYVINGYPVITLYGFVHSKQIDWQNTFFITEEPSYTTESAINTDNFDCGDVKKYDHDENPSSDISSSDSAGIPGAEHESSENRRDNSIQFKKNIGSAEYNTENSSTKQMDQKDSAQERSNHTHTGDAQNVTSEFRPEASTGETFDSSNFKKRLSEKLSAGSLGGGSGDGEFFHSENRGGNTRNSADRSDSASWGAGLNFDGGVFSPGSADTQGISAENYSENDGDSSWSFSERGTSDVHVTSDANDGDSSRSFSEHGTSEVHVTSDAYDGKRNFWLYFWIMLLILLLLLLLSIFLYRNQLISYFYPEYVSGYGDNAIVENSPVTEKNSAVRNDTSMPPLEINARPSDDTVVVEPRVVHVAGSENIVQTDPHVSAFGGNDEANLVRTDVSTITETYTSSNSSADSSSAGSVEHNNAADTGEQEQNNDFDTQPPSYAAGLYRSNDYSFGIAESGDSSVLHISSKTDPSKQCDLPVELASRDKVSVEWKVDSSNCDLEYAPNYLKCDVNTDYCGFIDSQDQETPFYIKLEKK